MRGFHSVGRLLLAAVLLTSAAVSPQRNPARPVPEYGYQVVRTYPHDPGAFTQGLEFADGFLYEGTGLNGRSSIRKVKLETGEVVQVRPLGSEYFGEGITRWQRRLVQLTWRSQIGFVYDAGTFAPVQTFRYAGEGWGLTHDAARLIMSDGTSRLRFWNPRTFVETGRITVRDGTQPVGNLNELEYVRGEIYANVWQTDRIVRIQPSSGRVTGWIDLTGLLPPADRAAHDVDVLNGIAWDATSNRLFVTGKLWPKLFQIRIVPRS